MTSKRYATYGFLGKRHTDEWRERQSVILRKISKGKIKSLMSEDSLRRWYFIDGMTHREIAERFDVSPSAIRYWFLRYGIRTRYGYLRQVLTKDVLNELYVKRHCSALEIMKMLKLCNINVVYVYLRKYGIKVRSLSEARLGRPSNSSTKFTSGRLQKMWKDGVFNNRDEFLKKANKDIDFTKKRLHGLIRRPTKLERFVIDRLNPLDWRYCGDGSVILNGHCPDFINCNGKKSVILVNGSYWHMRRKSRTRAEAELFEAAPYKELGYKVIFIWEELLDRIDWSAL